MSEEIVNYFQRVLRSKMEKGDWLILLILFGSIFVLSCWFGGPVGGFTFILAVATIWNIRITQGLLKQSKEALEQSRISFLVDIVDRTIEYAEKCQNPKVANQAKHIVNKSKAIKKISGDRSLEFLDAMIDWSVGELRKILELHRKSL